MLAVAAVLGRVSNGQTSPTKPDAPVVLVKNGEVHLAWRLPVYPRADGVMVFRATKSGDDLIELSQIRVPNLSYVDRDVTAGTTYLYQLRAFRGTEVSDYSPSVEVRVQTGTRITFKGSTLDRAVFEVTLVREGQVFTREFVHSTGDVVGDMAFEKGLDAVLDYRVGATIASLGTRYEPGSESVRLTMLDPDGKEMIGADGEPVQLGFKFPSARREVSACTLRLSDQSERTLVEGETIQID